MRLISKKKPIMFTSVFIAGTGIILLFLIDGGMSLLCAGIFEMVKWTFRP